MLNENHKEMFAAALKSEPEAFRVAFETALAPHLKGHLDASTAETAKEMFGDKKAAVEEEEFE